MAQQLHSRESATLPSAEPLASNKTPLRMKIIRDTILQVYAGQKSRQTIDLVLDAFIPGYEKLNADYAIRLDDENSPFTSEDEMINYFIENAGLTQTFYWNKNHDNPDKIMVGARITEDDKLIMSLTIDGTEETAKHYFEKLKTLLHSDIGVISHVDPAVYENGADFVSKYGRNTRVS